jgi:hypothetical protein
MGAALLMGVALLMGAVRVPQTLCSLHIEAFFCAVHSASKNPPEGTYL